MDNSVSGCCSPDAARMPFKAFRKRASASACLPCLPRQSARLLTDDSVSGCCSPNAARVPSCQGAALPMQHACPLKPPEERLPPHHACPGCQGSHQGC
eukprot:363428-Chlamydomonas_euryale.AAC.9